MNLKGRRWKKMNELFKEVEQFQEHNYPIDHRELISVLLNKYVTSEQLRDMYNIYGITYEQYINDLSNSYLNYKSRKLSEAWQKNIKTN